MAITHVAGQSGRGTCGSGATSIPVTMALTPTNGNVLIAAIYADTDQANNVASIVQTGVTWAGLGNPQVIKQAHVAWNSGAYENVEIWIGIVGAGANTSVTVNLNAATSGGGVADIYEYSGVATISFLDKTATNLGHSDPKTTDTGTTAATTQANELWIGATVAVDGTWGMFQSLPTNGFTLYDGVAILAGTYNHSLAFLEKIVSSTGAANSGTTFNGSGDWAGCIATFFASTITPAPKGTIAIHAKLAGII